ncbi:ABC transporter substrate-binding protein [Paenibacillus eucommiae]|uniref:Iron complex transport system substrate-binding protein n=1 Tax=Paenibacillus eucommiae TaxID=1355755 RepID=A0ABS4IPA2_9BACL|nr:ABC transporter substrate-binding protein [Paenibacillus eucommiae]MBP1989391.1 iron complex transport system substrate-binding protein [Paenibacillus eucommiae]
MKRATVFVFLCFIMILTACGNPASGGEDQQKLKEVENSNGEKVKIPIHPKRIADLSGSTEELLLLGITPIASGNVDFGNKTVFSPTIKDILSADTVNLGWYAEPISLELVASTKPDLIILGTLFNEDLYEQLTKIAPTVIVPYPYYEWRNRFSFLSNLFGEEEKKDKWLADYEKKVEEWKKKLESVLKNETFAVIETYPKNLVIYSSSGTAELIYQDLGLKRTPGIPEPESWGGLEITLESLASIDPDHLILMENSENTMNDSKVWSNLKAVRNGNIYKITNVDNYNYSFTAMGRMEMLDRIGTLIQENHKSVE